jgi:hypothetical protein
MGSRVLLIDECNGMDEGSEGSPIDLAEKRTLRFGDRKIVMARTSTRSTLTRRLCRQ